MSWDKQAALETEQKAREDFADNVIFGMSLEQIEVMRKVVKWMTTWVAGGPDGDHPTSWKSLAHIVRDNVK